jgi:hypothetical protein
LESARQISPENKKILLKYASPECLDSLVDRSEDITRELLSCLPSDISAITIIMEKCDNHSRIKGAIVEIIDTYIDNLTLESAQQISPENKKTLLKYADPTFLKGFVSDKGEMGGAIFLHLFSAVGPQDTELKNTWLGTAQEIVGPLIDVMLADLKNFENKKPATKQRCVANTLGSFCFNAGGGIDRARAGLLQAALKSNFDLLLPKRLPEFVPGIRFEFSQISCVLDNLMENTGNQDSLLNILEGAQNKSPGLHGQRILHIMSKVRKPETKPKLGEAILISLFSLHRQKGLYTCAIDSMINAKIRNSPDSLALMYIDMLTQDHFTTPGGHRICQRPIKKHALSKKSYIPIDLSKGWAEAVKDLKTPKAKALQRAAKIKPTKHGLILPSPKDLNGMFFANFFQASLFGDENLKEHGHGNYAVSYIYDNLDSSGEIYNTLAIDVSKSGIGGAIGMLQAQARIQKNQGLHYMRISSTFSNGGGHAENIDIDALLKLDLNTLQPNESYIIGDRNWEHGGFPVYLAVVKLANGTYCLRSLDEGGGRATPAQAETDDFNYIAFYKTGVAALRSP